MASALFVCFCTFAATGISRAGDHATRVITLLSSGTRTAATGQSSSYNVSSYYECLILVNATAEGGESTLDITVESSDDNATWYEHTAITKITATGQYLEAIANFGKYIRINYTVGGTSFTFSVAGVFKN